MARSKPTIERIIVVGTDVAGYHLYHPEDLAHRNKFSAGWTVRNCTDELAGGNLIAFETGGDGRFSFRLTSGKLTRLEQVHRVCGWDFRADVRHGRLFLDNDEYLPHRRQEYDPRDTEARRYDSIKDQWVELPVGRYRVSVHAIRNFTGEDYEMIEGLTSYVIQFSRVRDFDSIVPAAGPVLLLHDEGWQPVIRAPRSGHR